MEHGKRLDGPEDNNAKSPFQLRYSMYLLMSRETWTSMMLLNRLSSRTGHNCTFELEKSFNHSLGQFFLTETRAELQDRSER